GERGEQAAFLDAEDGRLRDGPAGIDARIRVAGDDEGRGVRPFLYLADERQDDRVGIDLALDAERAFVERQALDGGAALEAERLERLGQAIGDGAVRVRVDDDDGPAAVCGHGAILAPKLRAGSSSAARCPA